jgi:hypothetical protein
MTVNFIYNKVLLCCFLNLGKWKFFLTTKIGLNNSKHKDKVRKAKVTKKQFLGSSLYLKKPYLIYYYLTPLRGTQL